MTQFKQGNMLKALEPQSTDSYLLFTANNTITRSGELVMGAGAALAFKKAYPWLARALGRQIAAVNGDFHFMLATPPGGLPHIGALQTKRHWRDPSDLGLIAESLGNLRTFMHLRPNAQVHLNYPGVGYGGLSKDQVQPLLETMPDRLTIWSL